MQYEVYATWGDWWSLLHPDKEKPEPMRMTKTTTLKYHYKKIQTAQKRVEELSSQRMLINQGKTDIGALYTNIEIREISDPGG